MRRPWNTRPVASQPNRRASDSDRRVQPDPAVEDESCLEVVGRDGHDDTLEVLEDLSA
jgi:hypothetical protein